jgi:beta-glucosidase-like glycosyl hydrolase
VSRVAELVLPAIRWDAERGFDAALPGVERALAMGVGGFIIFGGERGAVTSLTARLRAASRTPLLVGSDLERGAGQQFRGLTGLPPFRALAALGEEAVAAAAAITAREALAVGVNWIFSPCADLDLEADNPIVQTRSFGADPEVVGVLAAAWIRGCQGAGALACVKHFPGHGRTTRDSHSELPVVGASREELELDLAPFRRAVAAGVAAVMSCHVAFPALGGEVPATYSRAILDDLLRGELRHAGLVVTDALIMEGAQAGTGPAASAVRAVEAGCDLLLYPPDPAAAVGALEAAARQPAFAARLERALGRREAAARLARGAPRAGSGAAPDAGRGVELCDAAVRLLRGSAPGPALGYRVEIVDDDAGGPYPLPPRTAFADELLRLGSPDASSAAGRIVLLFADVKSWKGRAGLSEDGARRLAELAPGAAAVVLLGHERRLADIPGDSPVLCAWSGDEVMQRAAARRLVGVAG